MGLWSRPEKEDRSSGLPLPVAKDVTAFLPGAASAAKPEPRPRLAVVEAETAPRANREGLPVAPPRAADSSTSLSAYKHVDGVGDLPKLRGFLTHGTKPRIELAKTFKEESDHLCAFESETGEVIIVVQVEWQQRVGPAIAWLRGKLRDERLPVNPQLHLGVADLLTQLLASARTQQSGKLDVSSNAGVKLFQRWLDAAIEAKAQDLHLDVLRDRGQALLRVNTEIIPVPGRERGVYTAAEVYAAVADSYGLLRASGSSQRTDFHQDAGAYAMLPSDKLGRPYRIRFQYTPTLEGGSASLRLLPESSVSVVKDFEAAGWAQEGHIDELERGVRSGKGGTIFVGKTGSGKSTTANLIFRTFIDPTEFIVWEYGDPIEIPHPAIRQVSAKRDIDGRETEGGDPFKEFAAEIKRQDPDYVNMGEIRDRDGIALYENTVLSGAACLGTLHASSIRGVPDRLAIDGMERAKMGNPDLLRTLIYLELIAVLCDHCKLPAANYLKLTLKTEQDGARLRREQRRVEELLRIAEAQAGIERDLLYIRNPEGCSHCRNRGLSGVTNALELYRPSREWFNAVRKGDDERAFQVFRENSDRNLVSGNQRGKTALQHAMFKAFQGKVDIRTVEQLGDFDRYAELLGDRVNGSGR